MPVSGTVTFSVGPDPVYIDGDGITSGGVAASPTFTATPPGTVTQNQPVSLSVAVDGNATGAPTSSVTFDSPYGSTNVVATAGNVVTGTLTLGGFPNIGIVTVPITVEASGNTVGRLVVTMSVTP